MNTLLFNELFILLLIIIIGQLIGKIKVFSVSLGTSGIILVALVFGHFGFKLSPILRDLGLVLFIYSVGLQAGPGFLGSFQQNGKTFVLGMVALIFTGCAVAAVGAHFLGYGADVAAGVFAGSVTSTPSLAVVIEATHSDKAAAAYGLTYCFGAVGVILFVRLIPQILKINIKEEEKKSFEDNALNNPPIAFEIVRITNPNVFGKSIAELNLQNIAPVAITRHLRAGQTKAERVTGESLLSENDIVRVVGYQDDIEKILLVLGQHIEEDIPFHDEMVSESIVVSKKDVVGRSVGSINFLVNFGVQLSRITRSGIDLPADPSIRLHKGDVLHLVGEKKAVQNMARICGDDLRKAFTAETIAMIVGIFFGLMLGKIPVTLPYFGDFSLGSTGGVLFSGLLLGYLYNTKKLVWDMPAPANTFIRELGLMLFLATVGVSAGESFVKTLVSQGFPIFLLGIAVTLSTTIVGYFVCRKILKLRFLSAMGVIPGSMTSTPGLAATMTYSETNFASAAYATVYPMALITKILFTKLMLGLWTLWG